jgi:hypothetical protein
MFHKQRQALKRKLPVWLKQYGTTSDLAIVLVTTPELYREGDITKSLSTTGKNAKTSLIVHRAGNNIHLLPLNKIGLWLLKLETKL